MRFEVAQGIEAIRNKALAELKEDFELVCSGIDPVTGKRIYVDCIVDGTTYRMDAGENSAKKMDGGVRIFERQGATVMPIIRDFHNTNHYNKPMATAISISIQQGANALALWSAYGDRVDALEAAGSISAIRDLQTIPVFNVNVE